MPSDQVRPPGPPAGPSARSDPPPPPTQDPVAPSSTPSSPASSPAGADPGEHAGITAAARATGMALDEPGAAPNRLPPKALLTLLEPRRLVWLVPGAVAWFGDGIELIPILAATAFAVVAAVAQFLSWWRFRWGFDGQVVRVTKGLVWRSERSLDVARIQQVDINQPFIHQLLSMVTLKIETASQNAGSEVDMDGLDAAVADELRSAILAARSHALQATDPQVQSGSQGTDAMAAPGIARAAPAATPGARSLLRPSNRALMAHALTGASLLTLPAILAAVGAFAADTFMGFDSLRSTTASAVDGARISLGAIVVLTIVIGGLAVLSAVVGTLLRFWEVELVLEGDDLQLTRGLFTKSRTTIPLKRLQVVTWSSNWARRRAGFGTLQLHSAGKGTPGGDTPDTQALSGAQVPWVSEDQLREVLPVLLARVVDRDESVPFETQRHPPAARRRARWGWVRGLLGLLGAPMVGGGVLLGYLATQNWAWTSARTAATIGGALVVLVACILVLAWALGAAQHRRLGHAVDDDLLLVSRGVLGEARDWMPLDRLQGVESRANWFQRRLDVETVVLDPAGVQRTVDVTDVGRARAIELGTHLLAIAAGEHLRRQEAGRVHPAVAAAPPTLPTPPAHGPPPAPSLG